MRLVLTLVLACSLLASAMAKEAPMRIAGLTEPPAPVPAPSAKISLDELFARQDAQFQRSLASLCAECVGLAGPDISIEVPALPPETQSDEPSRVHHPTKCKVNASVQSPLQWLLDLYLDAIGIAAF